MDKVRGIHTPNLCPCHGLPEASGTTEVLYCAVYILHSTAL